VRAALFGAGWALAALALAGLAITVAALTRNHDDDWSETWLLAGFVGPFVPDIPIGQEPF
jgi:hypothetical protein